MLAFLFSMPVFVIAINDKQPLFSSVFLNCSMRAVIQRVSEANLHIDGARYSGISNGLVVLLGIENADTQEDIQWLCQKIVQLRIFSDEIGAMNISLLQNGGELLLVSQFTLMASCQKGNRPSFIQAAKPDVAIPIYQNVINRLEDLLGKPIATGLFGADMKVQLINDGPVTIILDTKAKSLF